LTHRSFQEYFAAVFITRAPPIPIRALLDELAIRRGDMVIAMAIDMNRNLVEKEWVLPHALAIGDLVTGFPATLLQLGKHVFGDLGYDATRTNGPLHTINEAPECEMNILCVLQDIYPEFLENLDICIDVGDGDFDKIGSHWINLAVGWWNEYRAVLKENRLWVPPDRREWPASGSAFLKAYGRVCNEKEDVVYQRFIEECEYEFQAWRKGRWTLDGADDAEWFALTSCAGRLRSIAEQVTKLQLHVESSLRYSQEMGIKLLD